MDQRKQSPVSWAYFLLGAVFGAAALLFVSPKSRESIARKAEEGKELLSEQIRKGQGRFQEGKEAVERVEREAKGLVDKAKDFTRREKDVILAAIEAGRKRYKEEKEARKSDFEI